MLWPNKWLLQARIKYQQGGNVALGTYRDKNHVPTDFLRSTVDDKVDDKVVQRVLRHAKLTKERYVKAFDPAVLGAMPKMLAT